LLLHIFSYNNDKYPFLIKTKPHIHKQTAYNIIHLLLVADAVVK